MKKILFALCVVLALVGCKKENNNTEGGNTGGTTGTLKFNNGTDGKLTLGVGQSDILSLDGADLSECDITVSDPEIVSLIGYNVMGITEGTATVTATLKKDNTKKATLEVTVVDALKAITWDQIMYMQGSEDWHGTSYFICRLRRHRTDVASDLALTAVKDHFNGATPDTVGMQSWVGQLTPEQLKGKWYPLYTKEDGDTVGLFYDSCIVCRFWLMSTNAYFNGEGSLTLSDDAPIMDFTDYCKHDGQYIYCLGDRTFADDPTTADQQYLPQGCDPEYCTGYIQIGHFDTAQYMDMYREYWSTGEWSEDYEYWTKRDSKIWMYFNDYDEEEGSFINGTYLGYPVTGTDAQGCNIYIDSDPREGSSYWCKAAYYYFNAKMFTNWEYAGLGVEYHEADETYEEEGLYLTGEFGPIQDMIYSGGTYPSSKPGKNGVRRHSHEMQPMLASSFRKQVAVNSTIGATLRMIMDGRKK